MGHQDVAAANGTQGLIQEHPVRIAITGQLIAEKTCWTPVDMRIATGLGRTQGLGCSDATGRTPDGVQGPARQPLELTANAVQFLAEVGRIQPHQLPGLLPKLRPITNHSRLVCEDAAMTPGVAAKSVALCSPGLPVRLPAVIQGVITTKCLFIGKKKVALT